MTAPLQVIALSFSRDAGSEDRILAEVDRLRGRGVLRLLDMLFVARSQDGTIERLTIGDDEDFGSLLTAVVPVANGDPAVPPQLPVRRPSTGLMRGLWLISEPGTPCLPARQHYWAAPLFDAIDETGGMLIGEGFLTAETGLVVGAEVAAMEEAAEVIAQAQAEEAVALLATAAAQAEAARAVADSQRIQSAAAADAIRALITAGLVEEAAAHEAVTALTAAGLIVAAADQAAADAVAEDIATIEAADEVAAESVAESLITIAAADEIAAEATSEGGARVKAASITMAEAQVLRYLPTPLPFSVIASKLGISRSAAKERAARLYNRLGGAQPGRGGQPGPLPGPHQRQVTTARTLRPPPSQSVTAIPPVPASPVCRQRPFLTAGFRCRRSEYLSVPRHLQGVSTILPMFLRCRIRRWAAAAWVNG